MLIPWPEPTDHSVDLIKMKQEMMNAMLKGGHRYEYSRKCVEAHYDEAIEQAKEEYEAKYAEYREIQDERDRQGVTMAYWMAVPILAVIALCIYSAVTF